MAKLVLLPLLILIVKNPSLAKSGSPSELSSLYVCFQEVFPEPLAEPFIHGAYDAGPQIPENFHVFYNARSGTQTGAFAVGPAGLHFYPERELFDRCRGDRELTLRPLAFSHRPHQMYGNTPTGISLNPVPPFDSSEDVRSEPPASGFVRFLEMPQRPHVPVCALEPVEDLPVGAIDTVKDYLTDQILQQLRALGFQFLAMRSDQFIYDDSQVLNQLRILSKVLRIHTHCSALGPQFVEFLKDFEGSILRLLTPQDLDRLRRYAPSGLSIRFQLWPSTAIGPPRPDDNV